MNESNPYAPPGARVADALEAGADLAIINRFGKRERDGQGVAYLIERALETQTPVVIAVSRTRRRVGRLSPRRARAQAQPCIALLVADRRREHRRNSRAQRR